MKSKKDLVNMETGEIESQRGELNKVIIKETIRKDGSRRIQQDFSNCPTMAEQHTSHLSDINYLIKKYEPDELQQYINARNTYRQEILGHDFSKEPSLQDGMNMVYRSRQAFQELDPHIKSQFKNHVEFLKYIDNPANEEKLLKLGVFTKKDLQDLKIPEPANMANTKEADERSEKNAEK